ncbi:MAG: hypothetical protein IT162_00870 [Bryobacterales bacterium]|nr:hypothetical protein [Bryobacterales bacterium]
MKPTSLYFGFALALSAWAPAASHAQVSTAPRFALELGGVACGYLATAQIPATPIAPGAEVDLTGAPTCPAFYDWVAASMVSGVAGPLRDGVLYRMDSDNTVQAKTSFFQASLIEIRLPRIAGGRWARPLFWE